MKPWSCDHCGREGKVADEVAVVFHTCRPPEGYRPRRRWIPSDLEGTTLEETWLRVFGDAYGYTPPTPEEAQRETGEEGGYKRTPRFGDRSKRGSLDS